MLYIHPDLNLKSACKLFENPDEDYNLDLRLRGIPLYLPHTCCAPNQI